MNLNNISPVDPDEDYNTEEEDFNEQENDLHEIQVDDDVNEPDAEELDLDVVPIVDNDDE
jgi:hypothetical protein